MFTGGTIWILTHGHPTCDILSEHQQSGCFVSGTGRISFGCLFGRGSPLNILLFPWAGGNLEDDLRKPRDQGSYAPLDTSILGLRALGHFERGFKHEAI